MIPRRNAGTGSVKDPDYVFMITAERLPSAHTSPVGGERTASRTSCYAWAPEGFDIRELSYISADITR